MTKRFGRVSVADELCLDVGAGDLIGVVGPNGAGKTSLFSIISGDLAPDRGRVVFRGRLVNGLDAASRCRLGIGRTYQVPRPFEQMTVFENVLVASQAGAGLRRQLANERAFSVLETTGLATDANKRAGQLGLLDRKRLELARALATGPRLLLLDEVAAGLTDPEVDQLIAIVRRARGSPAGGDPVAVIWVEHVVRALSSTVDRLICLDEGVIIADGQPGAVLADPRVKEVYLGTEEPWEPDRGADNLPDHSPATRQVGPCTWAPADRHRAMNPLLEVRDLTVRHGQLEAVRGVSLTIGAGEVLGIIGANGAGKSTLLRTIAGLHQPTAGAILLDNVDITRLPPEKRVSAGLVLVPEGRRLFGSLNVEENLLAGCYRPARAHGLWLVSSPCSRGWQPAAVNPPPSFPVASSRPWLSPGPCSPTPGCSCSTSPPWAWPRFLYNVFTPSCQNWSGLASEFYWWNKTFAKR